MEVGKVTKEMGEDVFVDFNRKVLVYEGLGSFSDYEDAYWVNKKNVRPLTG